MSEDGMEQKYIKEAFDTNWVVPLGPNVNGFEKDLEEFVGQNKRVVALSSGTAAVHLGLSVGQLALSMQQSRLIRTVSLMLTWRPCVWLSTRRRLRRVPSGNRCTSSRCTVVPVKKEW